MPWIPEEHMADVHIIRQDFAEALKAHEADPEDGEALTAYEDAFGRRARAIRMVHNEDGASARHLSGMFRCSKTAIREALADAID
jgi:hypothetical protein